MGPDGAADNAEEAEAGGGSPEEGKSPSLCWPRVAHQRLCRLLLLLCSTPCMLLLLLLLLTPKVAPSDPLPAARHPSARAQPVPCAKRLVGGSRSPSHALAAFAATDTIEQHRRAWPLGIQRRLRRKQAQAPEANLGRGPYRRSTIAAAAVGPRKGAVAGW